MAQLSKEQRVFVVKTYYETGKYIEVINLFRQRFPGRNPPNKTTIWRNIIKYETHATSLNRNPNNSGRRRTGRSQENIDEVQEALENNPKEITCRENGLGLTSATFNRICRLDLKWHPYRMTRRHQLKQGDYDRRTAFSEWFLQQNRNPHFLPNMLTLEV